MMHKDHPHFPLSLSPRILMALAYHLLAEDCVVNFLGSSSQQELTCTLHSHPGESHLSPVCEESPTHFHPRSLCQGRHCAASHLEDVPTITTPSLSSSPPPASSLHEGASDRNGSTSAGDTTDPVIRPERQAPPSASCSPSPSSILSTTRF